MIDLIRKFRFKNEEFDGFLKVWFDICRPEFREMEYREWLADIISLGAIRRDDEDHDSKLINSILEETCEEWDYEKGNPN